MKYIIIGLGNYGHMLAEELSVLGHEVIGADVSASRVDSIKEKIATAFVLDATDEQALAALPLSGVDVVIVAIGENFGASIRVVALLKQQKVAHIYARAIDNVHRSVLEAFGFGTDSYSGGRCSPWFGAFVRVWLQYGNLPGRYGLLCGEVRCAGEDDRILC